MSVETVAPELAYDPGELIAGAKDWIYKLARRHSAKINRPDLVDDFFQALMTRLYEHTSAGGYDPKRSAFTTYVAAVARSVFQDAAQIYCFAVVPPRYTMRAARHFESNPLYQFFEAVRRPTYSIGGAYDPDDPSYDLADTREPDVDEDGLTHSLRRQMVLVALSRLSPRERVVVRLRYGIDATPHTLKEVGEVLGMTKERVRQIEDLAIRKLQEYCRPADEEVA